MSSYQLICTPCFNYEKRDIVLFCCRVLFITHSKWDSFGLKPYIKNLRGQYFPALIRAVMKSGTALKIF
jgi:hypothetical protein